MTDIVDKRVKFNPAMVPIILDTFARECSLKAAAVAVGVDVITLQKWRLEDAAFNNLCTQALDAGYEVLADKLIGITEVFDDVNKARLESDNIKWYLARRARDRYGDRLEVNINQTVDIKGALANARSRVIPIRDQDTTIDAEYRETPNNSTQCATDSESGAPDPGDAKPLNLEELLK